MTKFGAGGGTVATVRTDSAGYYQFDVFDGLGVGNYAVRLLDVTQDQATTPIRVDVSITRGHDDQEVDFGLRGPVAPGPTAASARRPSPSMLAKARKTWASATNWRCCSKVSRR